jgi:hypothetical protein
MLRAAVAIVTPWSPSPAIPSRAPSSSLAASIASAAARMQVRNVLIG